MAWPFNSKSFPALLFLHVAKCGGTSLVEHLGQLGRRGLCLGFACDTKDEVKSRATGILAGSNVDARKIRAVYGHRVFYGLHTLFEQECLYSTMLRNPVDRVQSLYNHHAGIGSDPQHPHYQRDHDLLWRTDQLMSFDAWLEQIYSGNHMTRFLYYAMEGNLVDPPGPMTPSHLEAAKRFLDRCWYIGTTETSSVDYQNMCDVIGMPGPQHKANVSQNFIDEPLSDSTQQTILEIDHLDAELYNYACAKRQERLITRNE